jgi:hypothetical protein
MMVRLLKPWKARRVGTILTDVPDGAANLLIKRRIVEEVKPEPPEQPTKPEKPKREKAALVRE